MSIVENRMSILKMLDEGYIKFKANWSKTPAFPVAQITTLNYWRQEMYKHHLIGAYPNGIGFGNISQRIGDTHQFIISGSATGNFSELTEQHYAKVNAVDIDKNELTCEGPIIASSESMSHAMVYQSNPEIKGVIHIHHLALWKALMFNVPTTELGATYGSPEMAYSILHLFKTTKLNQEKIFVMQSHEEGVFAFGETLEEAANVVLKWKANILK